MSYPHLDLARGHHRTSGAELLRRGRGVLLDLADNAVLRRRAAPWADRIDVVTATAADDLPGGTTAVPTEPEPRRTRSAALTGALLDASRTTPTRAPSFTATTVRAATSTVRVPSRLPASV